jgi:hypothetical protein
LVEPAKIVSSAREGNGNDDGIVAEHIEAVAVVHLVEVFLCQGVQRYGQGIHEPIFPGAQSFSEERLIIGCDNEKLIDETMRSAKRTSCTQCNRGLASYALASLSNCNVREAFSAEVGMTGSQNFASYALDGKYEVYAPSDASLRIIHSCAGEFPDHRDEVWYT